MLSLATSGRHSYLLLKGAEPAAVTLRSKSSDTHTVNIGAQNQRCDSKKKKVWYFGWKVEIYIVETCETNIKN